MKLEALKIMADNGRPLDLRLEIRNGQSFISRDGGPEVIYEKRVVPLITLKRQLDHYPREVSINDERLKTTSRPTLAEVKILEPTKGETNGEGHSHLDLGESTKNPMFNANVGGVWTTVRRDITGEGRHNNIYFSQMPGEARHHRFLKMVTMNPYLEIEAEEIEMLREKNSIPEIAHDSELYFRVGKREEAMLQRTKDHPTMPEPHRGRVYSCPLAGDTGAEKAFIPAPVAVLGTPVVIDQEQREVTQGDSICAPRHAA